MKENKKKFMKKGIFFIIIFLLIVLLLNHFYILMSQDKLIYRKEFEWQQYKKNLPANALSYAFFGDSHTANDVNPEYINNSFNFATYSEDYIETYYKIKKLLEKDNVKINSVVLEIDMHTFSDRIRTEEALFSEVRYYNEFISLDEMSKLKGNKSKISLLLGKYLPFLGNGKELISLTIKKGISPLKLGWVKLDSNWSLELNKEVTASRRYNDMYRAPGNLLTPGSVNYFLEILKLCEKNDIQIILIKYPVTKEYYDELAKHNISREQHYYALFNEIDRITKNYAVLDYYNCFFQQPEYFGDVDHLNYVGSEVLSKKINKDLMNVNTETKCYLLEKEQKCTPFPQRKINLNFPRDIRS